MVDGNENNEMLYGVKTVTEFNQKLKNCEEFKTKWKI